MYDWLAIDRDRIRMILTQVLEDSVQFFESLSSRPAAVVPDEVVDAVLPISGLGAERVLSLFHSKYASKLSGSAGPRYFGLVTGGATPASVVGDWITAVFDQNATGSHDSIAPEIELAAIRMLAQLLGLPDAFEGVFVTGATMANFVGLATARQWAGHQSRFDIAQSGLASATPIRILSGTPHSSVHKAVSMLGLGRDCIETIATLPDREAIDTTALRWRLIQLQDSGESCIVVGNSGTVNTVDFDDLETLGGLCREFNAWFHVDAAFGGFAACVPTLQEHVRGQHLADSLTVDAHKWLNVPYDCGMIFTRHLRLQYEVFQNAAGYLDDTVSPSNFINLTPENSRRFRALPVWFSLMAYGREGYQEIVTRCCHVATEIGGLIDQCEHFELLAPVRLNGLVFTLSSGDGSVETIRRFLHRVQAGGVLYLTETIYRATPAIRLSVTNWRTTPDQVAKVWQGLLAALCSEAH